jgi:hypothetical protein
MVDFFRHTEPAGPTNTITISSLQETVGDEGHLLRDTADPIPFPLDNSFSDPLLSEMYPGDGLRKEPFSVFLLPFAVNELPNFNGDYSVFPMLAGLQGFRLHDYTIGVDPAPYLYVKALTVGIVSEGATTDKMDPGNYGHIPPLTNGISINLALYIGAAGPFLPVDVQITDVNFRIKDNADWVALSSGAHRTHNQQGGASSRQLWYFTIDFSRIDVSIRIDAEAPGSVDITRNPSQLTVLLNDDFSNLDGHFFMAHGYRVNTQD